MKGKGREMWCREGEKVGSKHTPISFRFVHSNYHATMTYKKRKEKREKKTERITTSSVRCPVTEEKRMQKLYSSASIKTSQGKLPEFLDRICLSPGWYLHHLIRPTLGISRCWYHGVRNAWIYVSV